MSRLSNHEMDQILNTRTAKPREIPWIYMIMVIGAPFAHWMVNASSKWPVYKTRFYFAAAGATALMVANRMILMHDAGYALREDGKWDRYTGNKHHKV